MNMNLKYFGVLSEITGKPDEWVETTVETVGDLLEELNERYPAMKLVQCQVSVNQKLAEKVSVLHQGDEIAILPPFSGG